MSSLSKQILGDTTPDPESIIAGVRMLVPGQDSLPLDQAVTKLIADKDAQIADLTAQLAAKPADTPTTPPVTPPVTPPAAARFTDLPNFKLIRSQTFDKDCAEGEFLKTYPDMGAYAKGSKDTSKKGTYDPARISVKDGALHIHVGHRDGVPGGAVPYFKPLTGSGWILDFLYGRVEFTLQSDPVKNYKAAPLFWPASDNWKEGEIDYPEGNLSGSASAVNHKLGDPSVNETIVKNLAKFTDKHVYAVEWTPNAVVFFLDGKEVARSTKPPTKAMHHLLQIEVNLDGVNPTASNDGYLSISDYAIWQYVK